MPNGEHPTQADIAQSWAKRVKEDLDTLRGTVEQNQALLDQHEQSLQKLATAVHKLSNALQMVSAAIGRE